MFRMKSCLNAVNIVVVFATMCLFTMQPLSLQARAVSEDADADKVSVPQVVYIQPTCTPGCTGAWVSVNDSPSLSITGSITVEAWIKPNALTLTGADQVIVAKRKNQANGGGYELVINSLGYLSFRIYDNTGAIKVSLSDSTTTLTGNVWQHVGGEYDASTGQMAVFRTAGPGYTSGALNFTSVGAGSGPDNGTTKLFIGKWVNASGVDKALLNSIVDEVRVSNVIRYTGTSYTPPTSFTNDINTKALYKFDSDSGVDGSSVTDSSSNGNTGTWAMGTYGAYVGGSVVPGM
jgi:hypothetical protein